MLSSALGLFWRLELNIPQLIAIEYMRTPKAKTNLGLSYSKLTNRGPGGLQEDMFKPLFCTCMVKVRGPYYLP